jgi:hypothetical protein
MKKIKQQHFFWIRIFLIIDVPASEIAIFNITYYI